MAMACASATRRVSVMRSSRTIAGPPGMDRQAVPCPLRAEAEQQDGYRHHRLEKERKPGKERGQHRERNVADRRRPAGKGKPPPDPAQERQDDRAIGPERIGQDCAEGVGLPRQQERGREEQEGHIAGERQSPGEPPVLQLVHDAAPLFVANAISGFHRTRGSRASPWRSPARLQGCRTTGCSGGRGCRGSFQDPVFPP